MTPCAPKYSGVGNTMDISFEVGRDLEYGPRYGTISPISKLILIDQVCEVHQRSGSEDLDLAAEVMRIIRAIHESSQVIIMRGGPADSILRRWVPEDSALWHMVSIDTP